MWTDYDIATYFYRAIKGSELASAVNGKLSRKGRPANSKSEDIIVHVLTNSGCGQIQRAYVNVNVYVPDQYNAESKEYEESTKRLGELASLCGFLFHLCSDGLVVIPKQCSQNTERQKASAEDGRTESYINNKIYIEISND